MSVGFQWGATDLGRPWVEIDGPSLARAVAALQLIESNQPFALKLHVLGSIAAGLPSRPNARPVTASMLRALLKDPVLQDPEGTGNFTVTDLFCGEINLTGRPFRFIGGSSENGIAKAQALTSSILKTTGADLPREYAEWALQLTLAVAHLSEEMCHRANIARTSQPLEVDNEKPTVPSTQSIRTLEECVRFDVSSFPEGMLKALQPISVNAGESFEVYPTYTSEVLATRPLYLNGSELIVLCPGELISALVCELQRVASEKKCLRELAAAHEAFIAAYIHHWTRLGGLKVEAPTFERDLGATIIRGQVQNQSVVFVTVGDSFENYDASEPFGMWLSTGNLEAIESFIGVDSARPPVIILSAATTTRGYMGFVPAASEAHWLLLDPHNLVTLLRLRWNDDPWELVRFARAVRNLEKTTRVLSESDIGQYGVYADNSDSFYLSDDRLPNTLVVAGDYSLKIRAQERVRFDEHLIPLPQGAMTAISLSGTDYAPIYVLLDSQERALSVELDHMFIWVRGFSNSSKVDPTPFLEGIAYWLWQVFDALPTKIPSNTLRIQLEIRDDDGTGLTVVRQSGSQFRLTIRPAIVFEKVTEHNEFDRSIVSKILNEIAQPLLNTAIDSFHLTDTIAPLGNKKMFLIGKGSIPELHDQRTAQHARLIPHSVFADVLDELGKQLFSESDIEPGDIPREQTLEVINGAVSSLFARLQTLCQNFDACFMIQRLIAQAEGLELSGRLESTRRLTRISCYGEHHYPTSELREQESRRTETALAVRFLIEYLSAAPPQGKGAPNNDEHDTMCALAQEITTKGMLSDARHYKLSDVRVSRLDSGRLGISRNDRFTTGLISHSESQISRALQGEPEPDDDTEWEFSQIENAAFTAEFGFTVEELQLGIVSLYDQFPANEQTAVSTTNRRVAATAIVERTNWTTERAIRLLDLFTLSPLDQFTLSSETGPWRFGRTRSYLRKPIVQLGSDLDSELNWGTGRLLSSVFELVRLYRTGRLKAHSNEMKVALGSVRQARNNAFERKVAERYRELGYSDVRERVTSVNGVPLISDGLNLGDIDVLVVDQMTKRVLVVEAKDFETARTPIEMSREMAKLRDDAAPKNARRAQWVRENLQIITEEIDGPKRSKWRVQEVVVTSRPSTATATGNGHSVVIPFFELR